MCNMAQLAAVFEESLRTRRRIDRLNPKVLEWGLGSAGVEWAMTDELQYVVVRLWHLTCL